MLSGLMTVTLIIIADWVQGTKLSAISPFAAISGEGLYLAPGLCGRQQRRGEPRQPHCHISPEPRKEAMSHKGTETWTVTSDEGGEGDKEAKEGMPLRLHTMHMHMRVRVCV